MGETRILLAALAWWDGKCPTAWGPAEHLANPTVNTTTTRERELVEAVAEHLTEHQAGIGLSAPPNGQGARA